jgi:hypothetical protein
MKLTETQRRQLEGWLAQLADPTQLPLSDDAVAELLGPVAFGEYYALGIQLTEDADEAGYQLKAQGVRKPQRVVRYQDARNIARHAIRNIPSRIKSRKKKIAKVERQMADLQDGLDRQVARAWKLYNELSADERVWIALDRNDDVEGLPAPSYADPPYEAVMDGELSPKRRAQIEALKRLLDDD